MSLRQNLMYLTNEALPQFLLRPKTLPQANKNNFIKTGNFSLYFFLFFSCSQSLFICVWIFLHHFPPCSPDSRNHLSRKDGVQSNSGSDTLKPSLFNLFFTLCSSNANVILKQIFNLLSYCLSLSSKACLMTWEKTKDFAKYRISWCHYTLIHHELILSSAEIWFQFFCLQAIKPHFLQIPKKHIFSLTIVITCQGQFLQEHMSGVANNSSTVRDYNPEDLSISTPLQQ